MSEYKLRRDRIQALTAPQLIAMGVPYVPIPESTGTGSIGASGLTRARNKRYGRSRSIDWPDAYPFYDVHLP
jgi:hypothetical protein